MSNEVVVSIKEIPEVIEEIAELEDKVLELEKRIDKAIKYIEKNKYDIETTFRIQSKDFLEENITSVVPSFRLWEILKGQDF